MMLRKTTMALALLALSVPALSDSVEDQLQAALKAYKNGDYQTAMNELKFAQADLQAKLNDQSKILLPDALPGWTAGEVEVQNMGAMMGGGGTSLSRSYTKDGGSQTIEIHIIANSPMIQMMAMMMNNPMMLQSDPNTKLFRHGSSRGLMKHEPNSQEWEANLMVGNTVLLQVDGRGLSDDKAVMEYLNAVDLKKVGEYFSQ